MKKLILCVIVVSGLLVPFISSAQKIGMAFDEAGTVFYVDGRTELVLNPDLANLPSAQIYVLTFRVSELSGYDYRIDTTDLSALISAPTLYPTTATNSGTSGDVRVSTGACFHEGDSEASSSPDHIRLAKHVYTWVALPYYDVLYCIKPSHASGAALPLYSECVDNPEARSFGLANLWSSCVPDGCITVVFEWERDGSWSNCWPSPPEPLPAAASSWGALKAAY
ncbi:MAG TPA: hypothetical protein VKA63_00185 [Candidatus Krumholzibacteria bacterium]|nr:hypothetical protein [Candidatus Krumholzibacteria bacterium]